MEVNEGHRFHAPWKRLFTSRTAWCLCGQYFACSYSFWFFITWFPTYLLKVRGFDLKQSAFPAGTPLFLGAPGSLFAGWISPTRSRRPGGASPVRRGVRAAGTFGAAALLLVPTWLTNPYLAVAAIALVGSCNDIQLPGAWTACMDVDGQLEPGVLCDSRGLCPGRLRLARDGPGHTAPGKGRGTSFVLWNVSPVTYCGAVRTFSGA